MAQLASAESLVRAKRPEQAVDSPKAPPRTRKKPAFRASDWQAQVRHALTSYDDLAGALPLTDEERKGSERATREGLPISITPYYLSLVDRNDPSCPIRRQVVPLGAESTTSEGDLQDPLGEEAHEVAPHLVQRYPDRVLLLVTDRCAVYCRFCTRSRIVGDGGGAVPLEQLGPALAYIAKHEEVRDVIVSGGDPLTMSTPRIVRVLEALRRIPHLDTIRLATRVPVTLPMRITSELVRALRPYHPLWVMTHFNHPKELTKEAKAACRKLADAGFPVMNQTVLLRGVNDDAATLEALFRGLVRERVRPYYLLQADPVRGTAHLRTPLSRGEELIAALQGRLTGIAMPKFICDTPGGKGKVPLFPEAIVERNGKNTILRTFRGEHVTYVDP
ncbi:MAG: KamA family radical SAM protein [Polyangiaceae bacterium]